MNNKKVRPTEEEAIKTISEFLKHIFNIEELPHFSLVEDGDTNWAFWINEEDTTSYLHDNQKIEWYGTSFEPEIVIE